ncbi:MULTISPECIES: MAPEG family protein [Shewanella]|uniref:MAPEG family protein n=1 Tax=Shewanella TaxID=22 RepID=UPI001BBB1AC9|nr:MULTISPECIES: MAPEG family protein [Shewanella]GIU49136.1 glutathione S-transferase [Shewanella sp. KT0246]
MSLMISGFYASLTALLAIGLSIRVIKQRRINKVGIGTGGNSDLALAKRVHENLLENAPMALILFMLAEFNGLSPAILHCFGTIWIVARLLHAIGLTVGKGGIHFGRKWGVLLTWLVVIGLAVVNIGFFIGL